MSRGRSISVCSVFIIILGIGVSSAQTGGAMLYANGTVKVNGQITDDSTSIFAGDIVDVSNSSAGSINRNGSLVVVGASSLIQYAPSAIEVIRGSARLSTSKGMSVNAGQVVVSPVDGSAKFEVMRTANKVVVVSREGALNVKDGSRTMVIPSQGSAELALGTAPGAALAPDAGSASASFIAQDRLAEHPFYGVVNGVSSTPDTLPICADLMTCIRPGVSNIRPCCCPPKVPCQ